MPPALEVSAYQKATERIVHEVFDTMLQYQIQRASLDCDGQAYEARTSDVTSAIFLGGGWKGAVVLQCSEKQCRFFAARLMGIPEPDHMSDDVRDAMGEVINMIGGNLKSVLPPGACLSMPSVLAGSDYALRICGSNQTACFPFLGEAGPLWVTLVHVVEVKRPRPINVSLR